MKRVLIINDFEGGSGAEVVYRTSAKILSAIPGVEVETFDDTKLDVPDSLAGRIWNFAAARKLSSLINRFRPSHIWVHNYHNNLSASILPVIASQRSRMGCATYLTCHDYFSVFYHPAMLYRNGEHVVPVPVSDIGSLHALWTRAGDKGFLHDAFKKVHWHLVDWCVNPRSVFDSIFCPSTFLQRVLQVRGTYNCIYLPNPVDIRFEPAAPAAFGGGPVKLAYAGRISQEKGLDQFIALAEASDFRGIGHLTIFGDGQERARLVLKYAHLIRAGKIMFAGKLAHDRLFPALREHDALVLPSIWYENAPLIVIEAAALGLPVLAHGIGSLVSFADEVGNKILYQNEVGSFAKAMDRLTAHLRAARQPYNVSMFSPEQYAGRLRAIMRL